MFALLRNTLWGNSIVSPMYCYAPLPSLFLIVRKDSKILPSSFEFIIQTARHLHPAAPFV